MSFAPQCLCRRYHPSRFIADGEPPCLDARHCPIHGKALSKRGNDDWTAIMGATSPNQTESSEKVGVTSTH